MSETFLTKLKNIVAEQDILENEPMKKHTTFQVGGPAKYFVSPKNVEQLKYLIALCQNENVDYYILGKGSNLLVSDKGFDGVMIYLPKYFSKIEIKGNQIRAGAGASLPLVSVEAWKAGLGGLEFAAGIPGCIGGGCVMNAGAYGGTLDQVIKEVTVLTKAGELLVLPVEQLELGYRTSCIPKKEYIVVECLMELQPRDKDAIKADMDNYNRQRREKQPLDKGSAGSTFKRPVGYFAGKLVDDAGLRGFSYGKAAVSEKHCGFVVNLGGATATEVWELCNQVKQKVMEKFQVELELEVKILGEF